MAKSINLVLLMDGLVTSGDIDSAEELKFRLQNISKIPGAKLDRFERVVDWVWANLDRLSAVSYESSRNNAKPSAERCLLERLDALIYAYVTDDSYGLEIAQAKIEAMVQKHFAKKQCAKTVELWAEIKDSFFKGDNDMNSNKDIVKLLGEMNASMTKLVELSELQAARQSAQFKAVIEKATGFDAKPVLDSFAEVIGKIVAKAISDIHSVKSATATAAPAPTATVTPTTNNAPTAEPGGWIDSLLARPASSLEDFLFGIIEAAIADGEDLREYQDEIFSVLDKTYGCNMTRLFLLAGIDNADLKAAYKKYNTADSTSQKIYKEGLLRFISGSPTDVVKFYQKYSHSPDPDISELAVNMMNMA